MAFQNNFIDRAALLAAFDAWTQDRSQSLVSRLVAQGAISGDEDVAQAMDRIEKEAMRMGVLVEDLLALARLDERRDVIIGPVDLRPIARDAALDVRATSPLRSVTVIDALPLAKS